jgi:MoxR-like ATPase
MTQPPREDERVTIERLFEQGREALGRVVVGNDEAVDAMLAALVLESHVLIEGPPGTAKTLMVRTLARAAALDFARIQFTPDLMPADLTGTMVFRASDASFELRKGPVFASIVLADEINRTPPKTQAALLEAMEEGQVTIEGETLPLPRPFVVCATENPIEFEGTYPLPEAQLDRFLFKLVVEYPDAEAEQEILRRHQSGFRTRELGAIDVPVILDPATLPALRAEAAAVELRRRQLRAQPARLDRAGAVGAGDGGRPRRRLRHARRRSGPGAGGAATPHRAERRRRAGRPPQR